MNNKRVPAVITAVFLLLIIFVCTAQAAYSAAPEGTVKLRYVLSGTGFQLYRIGVFADDGATLSAPFDEYSVDLNNSDAAYTLAGYVERDKIEPLDTAVTDIDGRAQFEGLEEGVYLLMGGSGKVGSEYYTVMPSVFQLLYSDGGAVEIEAKYGVELGARRFRLNCLKVWEDDEDTHPEITASLLCDGELYETFTLNEDNNWSYTWNDIEPDHEWLVAEDLDTDEYNVSVSREGNTITVVNTAISGPFIVTPVPTGPATEPATVPEPTTTDSVIPQTGHLNWLIFVLVITGAVLCFVGVLLGRKEKDEE